MRWMADRGSRSSGPGGWARPWSAPCAGPASRWWCSTAPRPRPRRPPRPPGPRWAPPPAARVVLGPLAGDAAVEAAYTGPDGVVAGLGPGTVVCESSTVEPGTVRRLEPLVTGRGAFLLDTPLSGSVSTVEACHVTIMAGGR